MEDEKKFLKNQKERPIFYQIVLTYMSYHFNDKEILAELSRFFTKIDKAFDGQINKADLFLAYNEAREKITNEKLEQIIKWVDFDKNGYIEYEEFIRVLIPDEKLFTDNNNLRNAFSLFDIENNGFITPIQVVDTLQKDEKISEKVKLMLKEEIANIGDEIIDFEEFRNIMLTLSIN